MSENCVFRPLRAIFGHLSDIFSTFFGHFVDIPCFWAVQRFSRYKASSNVNVIPKNHVVLLKGWLLKGHRYHLGGCPKIKSLVGSRGDCWLHEVCTGLIGSMSCSAAEAHAPCTLNDHACSHMITCNSSKSPAFPEMWGPRVSCRST